MTTLDDILNAIDGVTADGPSISCDCGTCWPPASSVRYAMPTSGSRCGRSSTRCGCWSAPPSPTLHGRCLSGIPMPRRCVPPTASATTVAVIWEKHPRRCGTSRPTATISGATRVVPPSAASVSGTRNCGKS